MKYLLNLFFLLTIIIFNISCDHFDSLPIINNSKRYIFYDCSYDSIPDFPSRGKKEFYENNKTFPNDTNRNTLIGSWKRYVKESKYKKLFVFIYDYDTLKKYNNIDTVKQKRLYVKRYAYSYEDLESMNWTITYNDTINK